jgi:hypothetical protein
MSYIRPLLLRKIISILSPIATVQKDSSQASLNTLIRNTRMSTREQQIAALEKDWAENPRWKGIKRP